MSLQELTLQLRSLNAAEKAAVLRLLLGEFGERGAAISQTPGVCGGEACLAGTRIPVRVLVGYRQLGCSDAELLQVYPQLSAFDLVSAWAYAAADPEEIAAAIRANDQA